MQANFVAFASSNYVIIWNLDTLHIESEISLLQCDRDLKIRLERQKIDEDNLLNSLKEESD